MNATPPFDTPVVVILFNRPHRIHELICVLREVRPARILAIADGPRAAYPADPEACSQARSVLNEIDWPCSIEREFAEANFGCDRRIVSGLHWAFSRVDRAIVLEDDILPHPSFFPWAAGMLNRFGTDSSIGIVSGRNPLGAWGNPTQDHIRAPYGSIWGWGATARMWRHIQTCDLAGDPANAESDLQQSGLPALMQAHWKIALQMFRRGELVAWDVLFSLRQAKLGLDAIHSPVNLIRNTGIGTEATRTLFEDDFSALLGAGEARPLQSQEMVHPSEPGFALAAITIQLLARCRNPAMAVRLARMIERGTPMPLDDGTHHHLTPFLRATESLCLLEHLAEQGITSPAFDSLLGVMRKLAATSQPRT
jgi:hypothetical protein